MSTDPKITAAGVDGRPTPGVPPIGGGEEAAAEETAAGPEETAPPPAPDETEAQAGVAPTEGEAVEEAQAPPEPDYKDLYLRAVAEADNVRKRARRDVAAAEARGLSRLARELLPALDNLDRALAHAEAEEQDEEHHLTKGIRLVQQDLVAALARLGIESYSPKGEPFDPHHHEAVAQQAVEGAEPGTIVEVYQPGYRCGGEVLRAAKVVVAG
jgi:molecular chaperone GrpE